MNAYRGDVFGAAYVQQGSELDASALGSTFGDPADVFAQVRIALDGLSSRPFACEGVAAHAQALERVFGVAPDAKSFERTEPSASGASHRGRGTSFPNRFGPADLACLEPQYLRPSDAKLPAQPLRTDHVGASFAGVRGSRPGTPRFVKT